MGYYDENKPSHVVDILGTPYAVYTGVMPEDDPILKTCDGYHDKTCKRVVVIGKTADSELQNFDVYSKICLRHELVHAFLHESGVDGNSVWDIEGQEHPEQLVAWLAIQFPKMVKAFQEVGAL